MFLHLFNIYKSHGFCTVVNPKSNLCIPQESGYRISCKADSAAPGLMVVSLSPHGGQVGGRLLERLAEKQGAVTSAKDILLMPHQF